MPLRVINGFPPIEKHRYFKRVEIVGDFNAQSSYWYSDSFKQLPALINDIDPNITAIGVPRNSDGFIANKVIIHGSKLTMHLNQDSYSRSPGFQNNKNVIIRKLAHTKKGHGSKFYATFDFKLEIILQNLSPQDKCKLEYSLKTFFGDVELFLLSSNDYSKYGCQRKNSHQEVSTTSISGKINFEDPKETYEYLTLALMNSNSTQSASDEFVNSYTNPFPEDIQQFSKTIIYGGLIPLTILDALNQWKLLSLYTEKEHILLYKNTDDVIALITS